MTDSWLPRETNTHQDHVIAHVLGTTVLGYFIFDEALYLVLDIGFIWTIFLDGEMGLLLHPVAISELELDPQAREDIRADIDLLLKGDSNHVDPLRITPTPLHTNGTQAEIREVTFFERGEGRRLVMSLENGSLIVETSLTNAEIQVYGSEQRES